MMLAAGCINAILKIVRLARKNHKRKGRHNTQNNNIRLDYTLHKNVSLSLQCRIFVVMLSVAMLNVIILNVTMLTIVIMIVAASTFFYGRVSDK
jgi:hypothetical protein